MGSGWSSRDRMLAALSGKVPDRVPCSFMIFGALRKRTRNQEEFVQRALDLGLDAFVEIPPRRNDLDRRAYDAYDLYGLPVRFPLEVTVTDRREDLPGVAHPRVHRRYDTPAGPLTTTVDTSADWLHGDRVPLFDDYIVPRGVKRLVEGPADLPALKRLLGPLPAADLRAFREEAAIAKKFAADRGLLTVGEWGVLFDAVCWLCGMEEIALRAVEEPEFVEEVFTIVWEWNRARMEIVLEAGVDLWVRRGWYENVDFLSPATYRRFVLPRLKREAQIAHQAGTKLGVITSMSYTPILDDYLAAGLDVLIGLDPVQDPRADFALTKKKLGGRVGLWGGVNGCVTIETGTEVEVHRAVAHAMDTLAPGGGFVLSPVDNVREDTPRAWSNVNAFLDEWKRRRG